MGFEPAIEYDDDDDDDDHNNNNNNNNNNTECPRLLESPGIFFIKIPGRGKF